MSDLLRVERLHGPFEGVCDEPSPGGLYCSVFTEGHGKYHVAEGVDGVVLERWPVESAKRFAEAFAR
mgnify:CR=1 FL=1